MSNAGRKLLFKTPEVLQEVIDKYFKECKNHTKHIKFKDGQEAELDDPIIPTIAGLAYHLGVDRQTIYNYEERDQFFDTIKKARDYIINQIETTLMNFDGNVAGKIFIAKNYGYTDRQVLEHDIHGEAIKKIKDLFF